MKSIFPGNKKKAVTFSYDDGVTQDVRLVEMFNKYNLKATFNINFECLGKEGSLIRDERRISHTKIKPEDVRGVYDGHEIASHTLTHPSLPRLTKEEIIHEVEGDRLALSTLAGYEVTGFAYPGGIPNHNTFVADVIKNNTGVRYARTTNSDGLFEQQDDLFMFSPTVYHLNTDSLYELAEKFISLTPDEPKLFYIWGHSYEFDLEDTWDAFEEFLKLISGKDDIFYGTNKEVIL